MMTLTALLNDISFFEVCASLLVVGCVEQIFVRLPEDMVGPGGWLLDTGAPR
ncbi:hypothetical protein [Flavimaricola marinus]|uniref:Uncharacterized protein n=1 Tax=Flavimaricola marinus TaxID=1819565 RepID=A0A238LIL4_9RHOB|nr:hypothetical protein [Flavimaricola marinus]SMY08710.1 hypothetical protein LOM8899_02866 [Flavimaricola marinus]